MDLPEGSARLSVAACQPAVTSYDVVANVAAHAAMVLRARARLAVFPELSLTGYHLDADAVAVDDDRLGPLLSACTETGSVALVGAPTRSAAGTEHLSTLRIDADGVRVAYDKQWLGEREARRFRPGPAPAAIEVDGWRVGLGICRDTGSAQHVAAMVGLRLDLYVAGVAHRPEELAEQEARAVVIARACRVPVVLAGFAGPTGEGFDETCGHSGVWSASGEVLEQVGSEPGAVARRGAAKILSLVRRCSVMM